MSKLPKKPGALSSSIYKNIVACGDVSVSVRDLYLQTIASAGKNVAQAMRLHDTFRTGKTLLGRTITPTPNEGFGNFASVEALKHFSYIHFNPPNLPAKMSYEVFRSTVDGWIGYHDRVNKKRKPTTTQHLAAIAIQTRSIVVRDSPYLWLFRNPKKTPYAFDGLLDKWLLNRLGLAKPAKPDPRVTLSFPASAIAMPRKPTFLDARWEDLDYWDASGKTRPTAGSPRGLPGLDEVVSPPPTFNDIHGPVHKI